MIWARVFCAALFVTATCVAATGYWVEPFPGAGRLPATANVAAGTGPLDTIFGRLAEDVDGVVDALDVDLFLIRIEQPLRFSAGTVDTPGLYVADPQLFLFDFLGRGIYMNDDDESGLNASQPRLPAGHPFGPVTPGIYYLGIGWWNNEPLSTLGMIFSPAAGSGTSGPDPVGGNAPLSGWNDDVLLRPDLETGYEIRLTGAAFIPEPGTVSQLLLGLGVLGLLARRLRRREGRSVSAPAASRPQPCDFC
jgi:hypothetical protein